MGEPAFQETECRHWVGTGRLRPMPEMGEAGRSRTPAAGSNVFRGRHAASLHPPRQPRPPQAGEALPQRRLVHGSDWQALRCLCNRSLPIDG